MNSFVKPSDFSLFFPALKNPAETRLILLFGGSGTHRHRLLRALADRCWEKELRCDLFYSAQNTGRLCALRLPDRTVCIADGNYFQRLPLFRPSAVTEVYSLEPCARRTEIERHKKALLRACSRAALFSARAERFERAARAVKAEIKAMALPLVCREKISRYAVRFLAKGRPSSRGRGELCQGRVSVLSPWGIHTDCSDFMKCRTVYVLHDEFGAAAELLVKLLGSALGQCGEKADLYRCSLSDAAEHLLLPERKLGFFTENANHSYPYDNRISVKLSRFTDMEGLRALRPKLSFAAERLSALLDEAVFSACEADFYRGQEEAIFRDSMDEDKFEELCKDIALQI